MSRAGILAIVLAAAVTGACGGAEGVGSSPTGPSSTPTASSQPQPSGVCVAAPTNLQVASIAGTVVTLQWSAVSNAIEYLILVGSTPSSSDLLSTNTTQPTYTWTAKQGKQYARVQARASCGSSSSSNEVEFTVAG